MVVGEHDPIQIVGELVRVGTFAEMAFLDPDPERVGQELEPVLLRLDQPVPGRTWTIVELHGQGDEDAPGGLGADAGPVEPPLEQRTDPRLAARRRESGTQHGLHEPFDGELEDLHLKRFLGTEMREEAALGEVEVFGQAADGQSFEADLAGQGGCALENGLTGQLPLAHPDKIVRTFVLVKRER